MNNNLSSFLLRQLAAEQPDAVARIKGSPSYPSISGTVELRQTQAGVLVTASIGGLPESGAQQCSSAVFALHIHTGTSCTGTTDMPFADAQGHYDPNRCPHPFHAGDLAPLFASGGYAWYTFLSGRFHVRDVIGRTVIVHRQPDDFTTQPSGNSGAMIACGVIRQESSAQKL